MQAHSTRTSMVRPTFGRGLVRGQGLNARRLQLSEPTCKKLQTIAHPRNFRDGAALLRAGEVPASVIVVEQGTVRVSWVMADGSEYIRIGMRPGALLGLAALVGDYRLGFTVSAEGACSTTCYSAKALLALMRSDGEFALELAGVLARWSQENSDLVVESQSWPLIDRIYLLLRRMQDQGAGRRTAEGVELRITQHEIASMLGSSRQYVNPLLRLLQAQGRIRLGYGVVLLPAPPAKPP